MFRMSFGVSPLTSDVLQILFSIHLLTMMIRRKNFSSHQHEKLMNNLFKLVVCLCLKRHGREGKNKRPTSFLLWIRDLQLRYFDEEFQRRRKQVYKSLKSVTKTFLCFTRKVADHQRSLGKRSYFEKQSNRQLRGKTTARLQHLRG